MLAAHKAIGRGLRASKLNSIHCVTQRERCLKIALKIDWIGRV